jgi:hypothetical protein
MNGKMATGEGATGPTFGGPAYFVDAASAHNERTAEELTPPPGAASGESGTTKRIERGGVRRRSMEHLPRPRKPLRARLGEAGVERRGALVLHWPGQLGAKRRDGPRAPQRPKLCSSVCRCMDVRLLCHEHRFFAGAVETVRQHRAGERDAKRLPVGRSASVEFERVEKATDASQEMRARLRGGWIFRASHDGLRLHKKHDRRQNRRFRVGKRRPGLSPAPCVVASRRGQEGSCFLRDNCPST